VRVLKHQISRTQGMAAPRFGAAAMGALAFVAVLLAVLGVYGLLAFAVTQRTSEFGIRVVLGARRRSILAGVVRSGLLLGAAGLGVGAVVTVLGSRLLEGTLFGIGATDPQTLFQAAMVLLVVTLAASAVPAWRAMRVNPAETLREG
jgi:putative ABC transport system permease protein